MFELVGDGSFRVSNLIVVVLSFDMVLTFLLMQVVITMVVLLDYMVIQLTTYNLMMVVS